MSRKPKRTMRILSAVLLLLILSVPSRLIAQDDATQPDISRFLPENAQLINQLKVTFNHQRVPRIVLAYAIRTGDSVYETGVRVLDRAGSQWVISNEEKGFVSTGGGNPMHVEKVKSLRGGEGVVVIETFSGAGTSTDWHVIAKTGQKFTKLDPVRVRDAVLKRRGYVFLGYNGVTVQADKVIEDIAGYSHGQARCCPDRPTLNIAFSFTGAALRLASVKVVPLQ